MSPLLYLIYVNDAPLGTSNGCRAGQFADDISAWTSNKNQKLSQIQLQKTLSSLEKWCGKWRIKMNAGKTQLVSFKRGKTKVNNLKFFGQNIKESGTLKLLGVTFGKTCLLKQHCKDKVIIANQRANLLKMLRGKSWGASRSVLIRLYKQFIRPVLEYGSVTMSSTYKHHTKQLEISERRSLRIALGVSRWTTNDDLYELAGLEPLGDRIQA